MMTRLLFAAWTGLALVFGAAAAPVDGNDGSIMVARVRLAQAGSVGGTLGKPDQSLSGDRPRPPPPAKASPSKKAAVPGPQVEKRAQCPSIIGVWNSWASAFWGKGDVTFKSDGTAMHNAGIPGRWWCENGQLRMTWGENKEPGTYRLSNDGKQITNLENGMVGFSK